MRSTAWRAFAAAMVFGSGFLLQASVSEELSRTAVMALALRSLGAQNPDEAFRNPDGYASRFLGPAERELISGSPLFDLFELDYDDAVAAYRERTGSFGTPMAAQLVRTRRIDELLESAVAGGATQIVILGAGFDSRAYRLEYPVGTRVFEVDLPVTQAYKRKRVGEIVGGEPDHVVYVSIDFTRQNLDEVLVAAGFLPNERTFFVWEGVTYYLPRDAIESTLRVVATHAPGSEIVFDYAVEGALGDEHGDARLTGIVASAAAWGEPWLFEVSRDDLAAMLAAAGLTVVSDVGKDEIEPAYLARSDGTLADGYPWWWRICLAAVTE